MRTYHHLSLEEREKYYALKAQKISLREIARRLGRHHSTFSRDPKRNTKYGKQYIPCQAQAAADKRAAKQRYTAPLKGPKIFLYVRTHLREDGWSPDQIAGRLPIDHPGSSIDPETIYRYIYSKKAKRYRLWEYLTNGRKKRMHKGGRCVRNSSKIPGVISIDLRPEVVNHRQELGHWETDNIIGKATDKTALTTTVERVIHITHIAKITRTADAKKAAVSAQLHAYPTELTQTMTIDNGSENTTLSTIGMPVYNCHAYHSWEKGTVENTNGIIRRYIPKGVSIDTITEVAVRAVEDKMNNTPRKCLGYLKPYERMNEVLQATRTP
jgi:transposase, IS30 family